MNARNLSLNYINIFIFYIYCMMHGTSILNWLKSRTTILLFFHWFNFVLGLCSKYVSKQLFCFNISYLSPSDGVCSILGKDVACCRWGTKHVDVPVPATIFF